MSKNGKTELVTEMSAAQEQQVRTALEKAFRSFVNGAGPSDRDQRTADFVFHMTDWYSDLTDLAELLQHPQLHGQKVWNDRIAGFLIHAVGHLMPAAKLSGYLSDPFNVIAPRKRPARKRVPAKAVTA